MFSSFAIERSIFLCRHGHRIDWVNRNWYRKSENRYDPYLSQQGVTQAKMLGRRLKLEKVDVVFSSPYLRAIETANYITRMSNQSFVIEDGIGEWLNIDFMEEQPVLPTPAERAVKFPQIDRQYQSWLIPTYPETLEELRIRLSKVIWHLLEHFDGNLLLVGHGMTVIQIAATLTNLPDVNFSAGLCALTKLNYQHKSWVVELNGDTSYITKFLYKNDGGPNVSENLNN